MAIKITLALLSVVAFWLFMVLQLRVNNAFTRSLKTTVDTERIAEIAPGDTVRIILPVTNNSWNPVRILGSAATCRISEIRYPEKLDRKRYYVVTAKLTAPAEEGEYSEALVLRTDAEAVFYGVDVRYAVRRNAPRRDTLWLGRGVDPVPQNAGYLLGDVHH
jgi:hypothetical protein